MKDSILRKVVALLDKAEATPFPDEAKAFTAKAQDLITKHGIENAVTQARLGDRSTEQLTTVTLKMKAPYIRPKMSIVNAAAKANRCRGIALGKDRFLIVGFESDVEAVELLSASLLIQAQREMERASSGLGRQHGVKSFRNAFLVGFAVEIDQRLEEAARNAQTEAEQFTDSTSLALVLRDRQREVDSWFAKEFPQTRQVGASVSNRHGAVAGQAAGRRADIGNKRVSGTRGALNA